MLSSSDTAGDRPNPWLGATGVAAAVANAVFDATGPRIRELPITPEKLVGAWPTTGRQKAIAAFNPALRNAAPERDRNAPYDRQ